MKTHQAQLASTNLEKLKMEEVTVKLCTRMLWLGTNHLISCVCVCVCGEGGGGWMGAKNSTIEASENKNVRRKIWETRKTIFLWKIDEEKNSLKSFFHPSPPPKKSNEPSLMIAIGMKRTSKPSYTHVCYELPDIVKSALMCWLMNSWSLQFLFSC